MNSGKICKNSKLLRGQNVENFFDVNLNQSIYNTSQGEWEILLAASHTLLE